MNKDQAIKAAQFIDTTFMEPVCSRVKQDKIGRNLSHLRWMVAEMAKGEMSEAKTMRWLGYIQGVLVGAFHMQLEGMKEVSRAMTHDEIPDMSKVLIDPFFQRGDFTLPSLDGSGEG